jgi:galactose mutarotase-like enzyme
MSSTIRLTDPASQSYLEVVPERGGIITRWQAMGQQILYLDEARFADPTLSVRGGIPILFPICGNLPGDTFQHNGQTYTLKQHGFARNLPWQVQQQSASHLTLSLESSPATLIQYPFEFALQFTYRLGGDRLQIEQKVSNLGDTPMPFSIGIHPYFGVRDKTQLSFELPAQHLKNHITQEQQPFTGEFDWSAPELDLALRPLSGNTAKVKDSDRQFTLTLNYGPPYATLVFWTIQGKDYYCLEPWSAPRNALNTGEDLTILPAGADLETTIEFIVSSL